MSQPWRSEKVYRPRAEAQKFVDLLQEGIQLPEYVQGFICGSWRRGAPEIGDLDILIVSDSGTFPGHLLEAVPGLVVQHSGPQIINGDLVLEGKLEGGQRLEPEVMHVDFYACTPEQRGAMLMFLTGPKALNVNQRADAKKLGFTLSQYGLFDHFGNQIDDGTEKNIYKRLGMQWIEPEDRQQFVEAKPTEEEPVEEFPVSSSSEPNKVYTIRKQGNSYKHVGPIKCMAFQYSREIPPSCKHIKQLRKELEGK